MNVQGSPVAGSRGPSVGSAARYPVAGGRADSIGSQNRLSMPGKLATPSAPGSRLAQVVSDGSVTPTGLPVPSVATSTTGVSEESAEERAGSIDKSSIDGRLSVEDQIRGERLWWSENTNLQVRKVESSMKQEILKATAGLREQFQHLLEMERQDRQVTVSELRREISAQRSSLTSVEERQRSFSSAPPDDAATVERLRSLLQQDLVSPDSKAQSSDAAQMQMKQVEAEAARSAMVQSMVERLRQEMLDGLATLRQGVEDQITKQGAALSAVASESEALQLKLSAAESMVHIHQTTIDCLKQDLSQQVVELRTSTAGSQLTVDQLSAQEVLIKKLQQDIFDQHSQQNAAIQACKQVTLAASSDSEQMALKLSAAETALAEIQHDLHGQRATLETMRQDVSMQGGINNEVNLQRAASDDIRREIHLQHDQLQELRQELEAQRMQQMEQSSKFSVVASDSEELKMKTSALETKVLELRDINSSMMNLVSEPKDENKEDAVLTANLREHFLGLQEAIAKLRSDFAAQSNVQRDVKVHASELESIRQDLAKLQLSTSQRSIPAQAGATKWIGSTDIKQDNSLSDSIRSIGSDIRSDMNTHVESMGTNLQASIGRLRAELEPRLLALEKAIINMEISPRVDGLIAERLRDVEEGIQRTNLLSDQFDEVLQLAHLITTGSEQLKERIVSESVSSRTFMVQTDARLFNVEKALSIQQGSSIQAPTSTESNSGSAGGGEFPKPPAKEPPAMPPLMSDDLKTSLSALISKLQKTVHNDPSAPPPTTSAEARSTSRPLVRQPSQDAMQRASSITNPQPHQNSPMAALNRDSIGPGGNLSVWPSLSATAAASPALQAGIEASEKRQVSPTRPGGAGIRQSSINPPAVISGGMLSPRQAPQPPIVQGQAPAQSAAPVGRQQPDQVRGAGMPGMRSMVAGRNPVAPKAPFPGSGPSGSVGMPGAAQIRRGSPSPENPQKRSTPLKINV